MSSPFARGLRDGLPVALSFLASFVAVGVFLRQAGFDVVQATGMTAAVFAGPAQYGIAQALQSSQETAAVLVLVLVINARFFVMAASLVESFRDVPLLRVLSAAPLLSASTFAVTHLSGQSEPTGPASHHRLFRYFVGVGSISYAAATLATLSGALLIDRLPPLSNAWLTMILPLFFAAQMGTQIKALSRLLALLAGLVLVIVLHPLFGMQAILVSTMVIGAGYALSHWMSR